MKKNTKNKKNTSNRQRGIVFVGISGGVDSALSAFLLKQQGFEVVGVFISTWHPDFIQCTEEKEKLDAIRICAFLDIPFLHFDFKEIYKKEVADYMISEYKLGRTPNPDVMCNKEVKFGAFLKKALAMGADYVAMGHYAIKQNSKNFYLLKKSVDLSKDQSYFLWTLKQEQLAKIIFPIGHLHKTEVRSLAQKYKISVATKKDSQGICFLGAIDLKNFLKHYIKEKKGKVLNLKGELIGFHDGFMFYTLGERHGFTITKKSFNDSPYYIVKKDNKKNILYVSQDKNYLSLFSSTSLKKGGVVKISNINWIAGKPKENKKYTCQIRYHGEYLDCKIKIINKNKAESPEQNRKAEIIFKKPTMVASGQSIVLYDKNVCLGGGIVF